MQYKILFVDDETANLRLLERLFRNSYEVLIASSGDEALDLLSVHDIALIVSDQRMPGMTGLEFLKLASERRPQTVRIILTGYTDANDLVEAINSSIVYKYVTKPWVNAELTQTVKRALQHYETTRAQRQLQTEIERLRTRLKTTDEGCIDVLISIMDSRVPFLRQRAERTAAVASLIGARFAELDREDRDRLRNAALLHEVVLFTATEQLLTRDSRSSEDAAALTRALQAGTAAIERIPDLADAADDLKFLFERYDGRGFPSGFAGAQIPLLTRIVTASSAYDKLRHPGFGSDGADHMAAVAILQTQAGSQFDPEVVDMLADVCAYTDIYQADGLLTLV